MEEKKYPIKKVQELVIIFNKQKVTRSWKIHQQSKFKEEQQDFLTINKLAISQKAISHKVIFT